MPASQKQKAQLPSPSTTPSDDGKKTTPAKKGASRAKTAVKAETTPKKTPTTTPRKRRATTVKKEVDPDELPHGLGKVKHEDSPEAEIKTEEKTPRKRARTATASKTASSTVKREHVSEEPSPKKKMTTPKKPKANKYGLMPGATPYPDWPHPTPEECEEVDKILSKLHGKRQPPKAIPAPTLERSGCGEVPSVLDALIRTVLSGATSGHNSTMAFQGLVKTFGILEDGIGKGSVNWEKVRKAELSEVFEAIKCGGLAANKSKNIHAILNMVHEGNQARNAAIRAGQDPNNETESAESDSVKKSELARLDEGVLSLDHMHALSQDEAMLEFVKFPGVGVKTAACVILFCMQRPCFAVDTHIYRITKWLGWVPTDRNVSRDETFHHLEYRIPDHLKYSLHALLILHGKGCPRCRAITGENSEGWEEGCVMEHLVTRTGARKGGKDVQVKKGSTPKGKGVKRKIKDEDEDEMEDDDDDD